MWKKSIDDSNITKMSHESRKRLNNVSEEKAEMSYLLDKKAISDNTGG